MTNTFSSSDYQGKLKVTVPSTLLTVTSFTCTASIEGVTLSMTCIYDQVKTLEITYYQSQVDLSYKTINICINGITNPKSNKKTDSFIL